MTCYYPKQALRLPCCTATGKQQIVFIKARDAVKFKGNPNLLNGLPCGICIGCRLERSRQWAVRICHDVQIAEQKGLPSCFITLTFNEDSLQVRENPKSLDKRDFQLFMKRLRKRFGNGIRYYHCGEYGELYKRPHYHAILIGFDFSDKVFWKESNGQRLYTSEVLNELWPFGFSTIGDATFDSAAYVARYIMKKHYGKDSWLRYLDFDSDTGEIHGQRIPEYTTMSRRPGIGRAWLDKYLQDVYPSDRVVVNGTETKPPRYYDSQYEILNPSDMLRIKQERNTKAEKHSYDSTPDRLAVRLKVKKSRIKFLVRNLE